MAGNRAERRLFVVELHSIATAFGPGARDLRDGRLRAGAKCGSAWKPLPWPGRRLRGAGFANFDDLYQIDPDLSIAKSYFRNNPPWR